MIASPKSCGGRSSCSAKDGFLFHKAEREGSGTEKMEIWLSCKVMNVRLPCLQSIMVQLRVMRPFCSPETCLQSFGNACQLKRIRPRHVGNMGGQSFLFGHAGWGERRQKFWIGLPERAPGSCLLPGLAPVTVRKTDIMRQLIHFESGILSCQISRNTQKRDCRMPF